MSKYKIHHYAALMDLIFPSIYTFVFCLKKLKPKDTPARSISTFSDLPAQNRLKMLLAEFCLFKDGVWACRFKKKLAVEISIVLASSCEFTDININFKLFICVCFVVVLSCFHHNKRIQLKIKWEFDALSFLE